MLRTLKLAYSWAKVSNINPIVHKVLTISCNLLNTVLKVKNRIVLWIQNGCKWVSSLPSWWHGSSWWELWFAATIQHHKRVLYSILLAEENQNAKFEGWFLLNAYCFCTIVKSNCKLNHCKPGTVDVRIIFIIIVNIPQNMLLLLCSNVC